MLRIYPVAIEAVKVMRATVEAVEKHDADLARQMRRALTSVPLNVAEGMDGIGGHRRARYATALGSANELIAAMQVADALGYCAIDAAAMDRMQHVRATLIKLVARGR